MRHATFDLSPLFRSTVGFDRLGDLLDAASNATQEQVSYPPYNIEKLGDDEYSITMAVAGFGEDDITITAQENLLLVSGAIADDKRERVFLHKGIANRTFERKFSLADHVKVTGANLVNGLLTVQLVREMPEAYKPRQISINGKTAKKTIEGKKAA